MGARLETYPNEFHPLAAKLAGDDRLYKKLEMAINVESFVTDTAQAIRHAISNESELLWKLKTIKKWIDDSISVIEDQAKALQRISRAGSIIEWIDG